MIPWLTPSYLNYRQTIRSTAIGERKIVRQRSGIGEYAHVKLSVEPLVSSHGFQFTENVTLRDSLPRKFLSYIEMGILAASKKGLWGFPVSGFLVSIDDGSYHEVDSTAVVFEEVARNAFVAALLAASPAILEPTVWCSICVSEEYLPAVFGVLNQRRFSVTNTRKTHLHEIEGIAPQSEVPDLLPHLAGMTAGTASCSMHPEGYEILPESMTTDLHCASCEREMRIPVVNKIPVTEKCLICGTPFDSPDFDASVPVVKR